MGYSLKEFQIKIPDNLIAQYPLERRDQSKLLVYDVKNQTLKDDYFLNLPNYTSSNDCIIYNDAKVINARLYGLKEKTDARLEVLLMRRLNQNDWKCLIRPARRVRKDTTITISKECSIKVLDEIGEGLFVVRFLKPIDYKNLRKIGEIPLPKYIRRKPLKKVDDIRYQTIFSDKYGAVASPTAGLHFTGKIVDEMKKKGALFVPVTLYVDWGTFKPVREKNYREHKIHKEAYEISEESAKTINMCIREKKRIICIGTTSVRTIESALNNDGEVLSGKGETDLYIYPGYNFKLVDGIITNFHTPDSTLILLVAAFSSKNGIEKAYNYAVSKKYRFFSYGDAMLLLK